MNKKLLVWFLALTIPFVSACSIPQMIANLFNKEGYRTREPSPPTVEPTPIPTRSELRFTDTINGSYTLPFKGYGSEVLSGCGNIEVFWGHITYQFNEEYELIIEPQARYQITVYFVKNGITQTSTQFNYGVQFDTTLNDGSQGPTIEVVNCMGSLGLIP